MNTTAPTYSQRFSRHLGDVMSEHGVTQVRVAEKLSRTQSYVSDRLTGRRPADVDMLDAVAGEIPGMTLRLLVETVMERVAQDAQ